VQEQPKFTLVEFPVETATQIAKELTAVLDKYEGQFYINQFIQKGLIEAALQVLKKQPITDAIPSPYTGESKDSEAPKAV